MLREWRNRFRLREVRFMTFIRLLGLTEQRIAAIRNQQESFEQVKTLIEDNDGKLIGAWLTRG